MRALSGVFLFLLACGGKPSGSDAGSLRTVHLTAFDTFHFDQGAQVRPRDLPSPRVWIEAATQFASFDGQWGTDGTGEIHSVPQGPYLLQYSATGFLLTQASEVDLSRDVLGRPAPMRASADAGTVLKVSAPFVQPYADRDTLQLCATNAGLIIFGLEQQGVLFDDGGISQPVPNDSALDLTVEWSTAPLLSADAGDAARVTRLARVPLTAEQIDAGLVTVQSLSEQASLAGVTMVDGQETSVDSGFVAVSQQSVVVKWKRQELAAARAQVHPQAIGFREFYWVDVLPYGAAQGLYSATPDLLALEGDPNKPVDLELDAGFGNPFPSDWPLFGTVREEFRVAYRPDAGTSKSIVTSIASSDALEAFTASAQGVAVGPVQELRVEGFIATEPRALTSLTPIISWSLPAKGSADGFVLTVHQFTVIPGLGSVGLTQIEPVATITAYATRVKLPPGLIKSARWYVFEVQALSRKNAAIESRPFYGQLPESSAGALSSLMSAP